MAVGSPVSDRSTVAALLLLTFATGLIDAISVLVLGHVFVANMTGNVIFLASGSSRTRGGPHRRGGGLRQLCARRGHRRPVRPASDHEVRVWLTAALGTEVVALLTLAVLAGTGVLTYHGTGRLILISGLAAVFGAQNVAARRFGIQELSTTVLTATIVGIGSDSRLAGGMGSARSCDSASC